MVIDGHVGINQLVTQILMWTGKHWLLCCSSCLVFLFQIH